MSEPFDTGMVFALLRRQYELRAFAAEVTRDLSMLELTEEGT